MSYESKVGLGKARSKLELFRANLKTRLIDHFLKLELELVSLVILRHGRKTRSKLELYLASIDRKTTLKIQVTKSERLPR